MVNSFGANGQGLIFWGAITGETIFRGAIIWGSIVLGAIVQGQLSWGQLSLGQFPGGNCPVPVLEIRKYHGCINIVQILENILFFLYISLIGEKFVLEIHW